MNSARDARRLRSWTASVLDAGDADRVPVVACLYWSAQRVMNQVNPGGDTIYAGWAFEALPTGSGEIPATRASMHPDRAVSAACGLW